jgi:hypothetical protein
LTRLKNVSSSKFAAFFAVTICSVDRTAKSISVVNVLSTKNRYSGICLADNAKFFFAMMQRRKVIAKFKVIEKVRTLFNV